jgi:hypothetical protein
MSLPTRNLTYRWTINVTELCPSMVPNSTVYFTLSRLPLIFDLILPKHTD